MKKIIKIMLVVLFVMFGLVNLFDVNTAYANNIPITYIDKPTSNQSISNQDVEVGGWALNASGIKEVQVLVNENYVGNAEIGLSRPDVDNVYPGYLGGTKSGYQYTIAANNFGTGKHTITVKAIGNDGTCLSRNTVVNMIKPQPRIYIDKPTSNQSISNQDVKVGGWALNASGIKEVQVLVNENYVGNAEIGLSRPDVDNAYPGYLGGTRSGYQYTIAANNFGTGKHTITVKAIGNDGTCLSRNTVVNMIKPQPRIYIDKPTSNQSISNQDVEVGGWALNASGIKEVQVLVNENYVGNAEIGLSRPDVNNVYPGYLGGTKSGYQYTIAANNFGTGKHTITVKAIGNDGTCLSRNTVVNMIKPQPRIYIDKPTSNQSISNQDVEVGGWALNASGIKEVQVLVNENYVGNAEIGLSRPDVDNVYPGYLGGTKSGYQYTIAANNFGTGKHTITVKAIGNDGTCLSRNTVVNMIKPQPRIYIDKPTSNQSISNQDVEVGGWALNASGIKEVQVLVNENYVGNAEIGLSRPDVDNIYPGYLGGTKSGYQLTLDVNIFKSGYNTITIRAIGNDGSSQYRQVRVYRPENLYKNTYYNNTFSDFVNIQMAQNPQTDLYGGGWKTAKKEDVEIYANPLSYLYFAPVNDKTLQITASSLNVRSGPGTDYGILTSVSKDQVYDIQGESNGWYKITIDKVTGWVSGSYIVLIGNMQEIPKPTNTLKITASSLNVRSGPGTNYSILTSVLKDQIYEIQGETNGWYKITTMDGYTGWISNEYAVQLSSIPNEMYQFLILSGSTGISSNDLDKELNGRGILDGMGSVLWNAARDNNINEIYLLAHALLETGNGTSTLAKGVTVSVVDGKAVTPKVVYNMFGIGARDEDAIRLGSEYAYKQGWFTPEAAMIGGTKWIAGSYINNPTYKQDTLYKMRWNPATPGVHQYATDIGWAIKQTRNMDLMIDIYQRNNVPLRFDIPIYQ